MYSSSSSHGSLWGTSSPLESLLPSQSGSDMLPVGCHWAESSSDVPRLPTEPYVWYVRTVRTVRTCQRRTSMAVRQRTATYVRLSSIVTTRTHNSKHTWNHSIQPLFQPSHQMGQRRLLRKKMTSPPTLTPRYPHRLRLPLPLPCQLLTTATTMAGLPQQQQGWRQQGGRQQGWHRGCLQQWRQRPQSQLRCLR